MAIVNVGNAGVKVPAQTLTANGVATGTAAKLFTTEPSNKPAYYLLIQASAANTATIYLGGIGTTVNNGLALAPGGSFEFNLAITPVDITSIYAISGSAGQTVRALGF